MASPHSDDRRASVALVLSTEADGLSDPVQMHGYKLIAVLMSTGWDAGNLTFQGGLSSGATFSNIYSSTGGEVALTADASRLVALSESEQSAVSSLPWLRLRSGTSAVPVAQSTSRALVLALALD